MTEITAEQAQALEELREQAEQYRNIFEATRDGLVIIDMDGRIVEANPAYCAMRGYRREELIGLHTTDLIHPDDRHLYVEFSETARAGGTYQGAVSLLRKDGSTFPAEVHGASFTYMGKPHLLAVVRDITERVRSEEQRNEQEAQYRAIFDASLDAILIADLQGTIVRANPAACRMYGYTHDEMIGLPASALIAAEDLAVVGAAVSQIQAGRAFRSSGRGRRKDGTSFPTEASTTGFRYMGSLHMLGVVHDITDRVRAEEQARQKEEEYRSIFEATTDGMAITTFEGVIVEANPALCHTLGYSYDEIIGRHINTIVHPEDQGLHAEGVQAATSGKINVGQARLFRKDGTSFLGSGTGRAFVYMGKPHVLSVLRDMTAEVQAYELLEQRVEERTRELSAVLQVSHNVASTLELEPLLGLILSQLKTVVDYTGAAIFIVEEDQVRVLDYRGPLPREEMLDLRIPLDQALGYRAVSRSREPVIVDDRWTVNPLSDEMGDLRAYFKARVAYANTVLVVPLMAKERVIGVVRIDHGDGRAYTSHHAALAMAFASQAAVAIENARLYAKAHDMAALEERHRLARELHDSVTQALYGVTMYAEAAASLLEAGQQETATTYLREVRETAQDALREMRLLIFELRPPVLAEEGLEGALRARLTAVEGRVSGLSTTIDVRGELSIPAPVEEALYGIAQETLNNIYKHARATSISLSLQQVGQKVTMQIRDNGIGFDPAATAGHGGLGLNGMAERATQVGGDLTVESTPGSGTTVRVEVAL